MTTWRDFGVSTDDIVAQVREGKIDGLSGLALAVIAQARWEMVNNKSAEARLWLETTGKEWAEMMGCNPDTISKAKKG